MSPRLHLRLVQGKGSAEPPEDPPCPGTLERSPSVPYNLASQRRHRTQAGLGSSPGARVSITPQAQREFDELPLTMRGRILKVFERLGRWPEVSGAKPMQGELAGLYRIRTGDYRVLFRVEGRRVIVERVGHRDGFYED